MNFFFFCTQGSLYCIRLKCAAAKLESSDMESYVYIADNTEQQEQIKSVSAMAHASTP